MTTVERYIECAFALAVAGVALVWPPGALIVAAAFMLIVAFLIDRRTPPEVKS